MSLKEEGCCAFLVRLPLLGLLYKYSNRVADDSGLVVKVRNEGARVWRSQNSAEARTIIILEACGERVRHCE